MKDLPVYARIGDGQEINIGTISADDAKEGNAMLAALFRAVADRLEDDA